MAHFRGMLEHRFTTQLCQKTKILKKLWLKSLTQAVTTSNILRRIGGKYRKIHTKEEQLILHLAIQAPVTFFKHLIFLTKLIGGFFQTIIKAKQINLHVLTHIGLSHTWAPIHHLKIYPMNGDEGAYNLDQDIS